MELISVYCFPSSIWFSALRAEKNRLQFNFCDVSLMHNFEKKRNYWPRPIRATVSFIFSFHTTQLGGKWFSFKIFKDLISNNYRIWNWLTWFKSTGSTRFSTVKIHKLWFFMAIAWSWPLWALGKLINTALKTQKYFFLQKRATVWSAQKSRIYLVAFVGSKIRNCFPARFLTNFTHKWIAVLIESINIHRFTTFWISFYPSLTMWSLV